jgi:hypothetical protein
LRSWRRDCLGIVLGGLETGADHIPGLETGLDLGKGAVLQADCDDL